MLFARAHLNICSLAVHIYEHGCCSAGKDSARVQLWASHLHIPAKKSLPLGAVLRNKIPDAGECVFG